MTLKADLQPTPDCIPLDRLGEPLTDAEQAHLQQCSRCEAELSLWSAYHDSTPAGDDGAAVQWIAAELRRRSAGKPPLPARARAGWLAHLGWRPLAGVAAILLVAGSVYIVWDPEPRVRTPIDGTETYRSGSVTAIAPRGDLAAPPRELVWVAFDGAVGYNAQVLEIDRTPLWRADSSATRIELPRAVVDRIVPGKTLLWTVAALDRSGRPIADSGFQSFRVVVPRGSGRN